ncbi:hypothetical protein [Sphingomonas koreensis]|jgi:hypothetical protein|uniref:hypothetical protein n=1 Tax=Sphingomonas koreensis TaxID=93064 RepID=UPI00234FAE81|nr:hypothetical protein [Sphingomonas koreensis]MDC7812833.1 hypothetical protein [Sphingomonas koreensis]
MPYQPLSIAPTLADLKAAPTSDISILYDTATFNWTPGNYAAQADDVNVVEADGVALNVGAWVRQGADKIAFKASGTEIIQSAADKMARIVEPEDCGAVSGLGGDPAVNAVAFDAVLDRAVALGATLSLGGRTYMLDASDQPSGGVNFARQGLVIKGGGAVLRFVGAGRAFVLDADLGPGGFLEEMCVDDLLIFGNVNTTNGFYSRGIVRSVFRNIEVRDVSSIAFHILHGVSNHYDSLRYSPRPLGHPTDPAVIHATHGLVLDKNGGDGAGYYTSNCLFTNPVMEDFEGVGCEIASGSGNMFVMGTFEAVQVGAIIREGCRDNTFTKLWFEKNVSTDMVIKGSGTNVNGCKFISSSINPNVQIEPTANGTSFSGGGYLRWVFVAPGSIGTSFHQVNVDENQGGGIGFKGTGPYTRIACTKVDNLGNPIGNYTDIFGPTSGWSPTLTPTGGTIAQNAGLTQGYYQKMGRLVFAQCFIYVDSVAAPTGDLTITGLPFVSAFRQPALISATQLQATATDPLQAVIATATIYISKLSAGAATAVAADVKANTTLAVSISYIADDE